MQKIAAILSLIVAGSIAAAASANKPAGAQCAVAANANVLSSELYTVSASGLPTGGALNLRVLYPSGNVDTTPITATNGSYSLDTSVDQTGVTYEFVGRVSWPSGSTNKVYATCSM